MSGKPWVKPDRIVAIFYDIDRDEFVLLRADGIELREPHSPYLDRKANEYSGWFSEVNGYAGLYASTYSHAVTAFAAKAACDFDEIKARVIKPTGNRDERPCLDD